MYLSTMSINFIVLVYMYKIRIYFFIEVFICLKKILSRKMIVFNFIYELKWILVYII